MKKKIMIVWMIFSIGFSGCNYLDMVPENDIETIETIFEKRENALIWLKSCYCFLQGTVGSVSYDPSFMGADEVVTGEFLRRVALNSGERYHGLFIGDGLQMSQAPYGELWRMANYYSGIRYCNIFIDNISKVYNMADAEKEQWSAEVKALKAYFYFELVQRYGPIVLVPQNIDVAQPDKIMQTPRSPFDDCIEAIVELLDDAMGSLQMLRNKDLSRWAYFNLEAAAALKAKTLLLAASPLFNGNPAYADFRNRNGEPLFDPNYDPEKWKRAAEAAEAAIEICENAGKSLYDKSISKPTKLLNTMNNIENSVLAQSFLNDEAILMIRNSTATSDMWAWVCLPGIREKDNPAQYHFTIRSCVAPSMKMVEMFYTDHGLPIDQDKEWDYTSRYQMGRETNSVYQDVIPLGSEDVLNLHLRREPRFYAIIAADRCFWQRGPTPNHRLQVKAYQGELFGTAEKKITSSTAQNLSGYWLKKGSYSDISGSDYTTVESREEALVLIRLAELYLIKAEAWNEYEGPSADKVYAPLDLIRTRAGIPDVETAWSTYSKNPGMIRTKEGMREIIHREWNIEFAFEGRRFWNLRRWLTAHTELNEKQYGWNIMGENAASFYNDFKEPIVVWSKRRFQSPRDYLFPIRAEEVLITGVKQNPGW